ncbi:MAG: adenylate/guanylate cyclase domain-containing protein [Gemmataceae bacterium]|nr:adenylate/guanylate cyclase domain-containing protein [Gemmataceae bacterium]
MNLSWEIQVFENRKPVFMTGFAGLIEVGRQDRGEPAPYQLKVDGPVARLIVARLEEDRVPRRYVRVEPLADGEVTLTNISNRVPLHLEQGAVVNPESSITVPQPVTLLIENRAVKIRSTGMPTEVQSLPQATMVPFQRVELMEPIAALLSEGQVDVDGMVKWLRSAMGVLQSAAGSSDFFQRAAQAVVDLVGLDSCRVLLRDGATWRLQALATKRGEATSADAQGSRRILDLIVREKRTFWELPQAAATASLLHVKALVAAPILDARGEVIGVLYGDRVSKGTGLKPITQLEANLVELLASGVAAGLARVEQEQAALRTRVQFEQYFTPSLSRRLLAEPELLTGREAVVTVLFCDIRGFSRISERLPATRIVAWTNDVLGAMSECVLKQEGVLVDYVGDELMAMWGAPDEHPDHAARACRAAIDMLGRLPALNDRWRRELGEEIRLTIGINTGPAVVGNIGSAVKFKYGPRGNHVNLASRVQGANKFWKTSVLITGQTHVQSGGGFTTRRLGQIRVVNIVEPVAVYELVPPEQPRWSELRRQYEAALAEFERKDFRQAVRILGNLLPEFPDDGPAYVLMARAVQGLVEEPERFDPVWTLPGK